jgi:acetyl esterase
MIKKLVSGEIKMRILLILILSCFYTVLVAKESPYPLWDKNEFVIYTKAEDTDLRMYDLKPKKQNEYSDYVVLCFFGGGWSSGTPKSSYANHFVNMGFRVFAPEYRTHDQFKTCTPSECADDAVAAYDYLIQNAAKLKINKDKIIINGFSAGGFCAALIPIKSKSKTKPHAMIFFSAVLDVSPEGYQGSFPGPLKETWKKLSPLHLINGAYPKTYIFAGGKDSIVKPKQAQDFQDKLTKLKQKTQLFIFPEYEHGLGKEATDKVIALLPEITK